MLGNVGAPYDAAACLTGDPGIEAARHFGINRGDYGNYRSMPDEQQAVFRLWSAAASTVSIRHPIPKARARFWVVPHYTNRKTWIRLSINGLPDNDHPDSAVATSFGTRSVVDKWPGLPVAQLFLLGCWSVLQWHESMEQAFKTVNTVPWKSQDRIIDPHGHSGLEDTHMRTIVCADRGDLPGLLSWLIGKERAALVIADNEVIAAKELENEIAAGSFD